MTQIQALSTTKNYKTNHNLLPLRNMPVGAILTTQRNKRPNISSLKLWPLSAFSCNVLLIGDLEGMLVQLSGVYGRMTSLPNLVSLLTPQEEWLKIQHQMAFSM